MNNRTQTDVAVVDPKPLANVPRPGPNTDDIRIKFFELQYMTLRKEIEDIHSRMFTLLVGGSALVPAAQYVSESFNVGIVLFALPFLVVILVLLFLSQNIAIMRCGQFIREHIEPQAEGIAGWENWEEETQEKGQTIDRRVVDKLVMLSFYALFGVYYIVSVYLGIKAVAGFVHEQSSRLLSSAASYGLAAIACIIILAIYMYVGRWTVRLLLRLGRESTSTEDRGPMRFRDLFTKIRELSTQVHTKATTSG